MPKSLKRLKRERSFKNCFSLFKKNIKITEIKTAKKRDPHKPPPGGERKDKSIEKLGAEDGQRSGDSVLGLVLQIREFAERSYRFQLLVVGLFFCGSRLFVRFKECHNHAGFQPLSLKCRKCDNHAGFGRSLKV